MLNVYGPDGQLEAPSKRYSLTLDGDLPGLTAVELLHSLHFRKRDEVTIFQTMPRLI